MAYGDLAYEAFDITENCKYDENERGLAQTAYVSFD